MPFGGYFDGYYSDVIRPALANIDVQSIRADEIYGTGVIVEDIHKAITASDFCLADVTSRNPNVSYELGMAHALRKPVLLVTQSVEDVPFDYRHLRLISYDPKLSGWEREFQKRVERTAKEVLKNPSANLALKSENRGTARSDKLSATESRSAEDAMRKHLRNIFDVTAYDLARTNHIYCDEHGNCEIKTSWKVKATSAVFHLCHNVVLDIPGRIVVNRVYDKINARDLDYVVVDKGKAYLSYFFLFKQFKAPGQQFEVETDVSAEGYIDVPRFLDTKETMMSTQAVALGMRYVLKADWLYFPKRTRFQGLYAEYTSHPRADLVGTTVAAIETPSHYLLQMNYDADTPYQQETAAFIRLP